MKKIILLFLVFNSYVDYLQGGEKERVIKCHKSSKSCPEQMNMIKPDEKKQKNFFLVRREPISQTDVSFEKFCKTKNKNETDILCSEMAGVSYLLLLGQGCPCGISCFGAFIATYLSLKWSV